MSFIVRSLVFSPNLQIENTMNDCVNEETDKTLYSSIHTHTVHTHIHILYIDVHKHAHTHTLYPQLYTHIKSHTHTVHTHTSFL